MPLTVVIGGQFGSEGKGKIAHFWVRETKARVAVRVGGPNSGHTVIDSTGAPLILKQLPTAAILPDVVCLLGAGSYIKPDILFTEIERTQLPADRLIIDPNAVIITEQEEAQEQSGSLRQAIGSTLSGTGAGVHNRINRTGNVKLARLDDRLREFVKPVSPFLRRCLDLNQRVIIEGTQGFGLSLLHSSYYPCVTSRDTSAAAFVSEAGLSPLDVDQVVMVLRAFPIRVPGNSGELPEEIDWTTVSEESGSATPIIEYTSVTKAIRRVARFDPDIVCEAITVNHPTHIVLNHVDYIDASCCVDESLTRKASQFVEQVEHLIGAQVDYIGLGPASVVKRSRAARSIAKLA